jgi:hypothetical protein
MNIAWKIGVKSHEKMLNRSLGAAGARGAWLGLGEALADGEAPALPPGEASGLAPGEAAAAGEPAADPWGWPGAGTHAARSTARIARRTMGADRFVRRLVRLSFRSRVDPMAGVRLT